MKLRHAAIDWLRQRGPSPHPSQLTAPTRTQQPPPPTTTMNTSTLFNQLYIDPPQFGWTAIGGIANVLEPHERARRVNGYDSNAAVGQAGENANEDGSGHNEDQIYYTIINEEPKQDAAADAKDTTTDQTEDVSPEKNKRNRRKKDKRSSKEPEEPTETTEQIKPEPEPTKPAEIEPKQISIQKLHDGNLDIHSYHRGRAGQEPRGNDGELLAALDPIDSNHDWTPSNSAVVEGDLRYFKPR